MSASAGYGITHHAVDRYIERVTPSSTRAAARAGAVFERVANAIATAALMHMAGFVPEGERWPSS